MRTLLVCLCISIELLNNFPLGEDETSFLYNNLLSERVGVRVACSRSPSLCQADSIRACGRVDLVLKLALPRGSSFQVKLTWIWFSAEIAVDLVFRFSGKIIVDLVFQVKLPWICFLGEIGSLLRTGFENSRNVSVYDVNARSFMT